MDESFTEKLRDLLVDLQMNPRAEADVERYLMISESDTMGEYFTVHIRDEFSIELSLKRTYSESLLSKIQHFFAERGIAAPDERCLTNPFTQEQFVIRSYQLPLGTDIENVIDAVRELAFNCLGYDDSQARLLIEQYD